MIYLIKNEYMSVFKISLENHSFKLANYSNKFKIKSSMIGKAYKTLKILFFKAAFLTIYAYN